jgi:hypothetical protein
MKIITQKHIENKIFTIRGMQVMIDRDLAETYQVETRVLNQAVKRNIERFPSDFRFQMTVEEFESWKSQIVMSKEDKKGLRRPPYVFTEQGVAMLSAVLRSDVAIEASIQIMKAFVNMRKFLMHNASIFQRLDQVELKQLQTDEKIERIFKALEARQPQPDKGIFFDGQIFDAYSFVVDLIKQAKNDIILIDNYIDESVLTLLSKRKAKVTATIFTKEINKTLALDLQKHNAQYPPIEIRTFSQSHDRFLIIDQQVIYHIGASLKDLGKKWFGFSRMDTMALAILSKLPDKA